MQKGKKLSQNFENLDTWKKAMELCLFCYELTKKFPLEEKFGLTNQLRRAGVSAPSNIAEGYSRKSAKEVCYFIEIAIGSVYEMMTQISIAYSLHCISKEEKEKFYNLASEVISLCGGFIKYKKGNHNAPSVPKPKSGVRLPKL
ncbi:four helix bundle protein [Candidatus Berkelbacteria bacterium CG10_big_fil_rev_8_21_14_0_10_43_13]|uniref:Four helix bundle protein n=1 Tax=Candidatus Berkelbacteria bacterium CG10_big_fil_rev_8_21_14_0_10_43_13 TaxID=1974514 RepID=A0A2H0W5X6_9BACT|nr:MAG: four helix bundle protein [Candidatus Berkelbacteria bacterium CG10_big_fil_rev_8_21_14_0_10_43_13]